MVGLVRYQYSSPCGGRQSNMCLYIFCSFIPALVSGLATEINAGSWSRISKADHSKVHPRPITLTYADLLSFEPLGTNFSEIWIVIQTFSFKKMRLIMSSAKVSAILSTGKWVNTFRIIDPLTPLVTGELIYPHKGPMRQRSDVFFVIGLYSSVQCIYYSDKRYAHWIYSIHYVMHTMPMQLKWLIFTIKIWYAMYIYIVKFVSFSCLCNPILWDCIGTKIIQIIQ